MQLNQSDISIPASINSMFPEEREKNSNLVQEYENMEYMLNFLSEIYAVKHGEKSMPFPDFVK